MAKVQDAGLRAEQVAAAWLKKQGLRLLETRVSCRFGELDLVMRQGNELVLVEVKYRATGLDSALASVSASKRKKLSLAAQWLYSQRPEWGSLVWRFDVIALAGDLSKPEVKWLPAAFELA